jgi:HSP20 family protein
MEGLVMKLARRSNNLFPAVPSLMDEFLGNDLSRWFDNEPFFSRVNVSVPAANIKETEASYEVELAAPGLKKDDFHVQLDNNVLIISSENKSEKEEKDDKGNYTRREFNYQSFSRSFKLPENTVNTEKIQANYEHGVLKILLPKKEEAQVKPVREIKING